MERKLRLSDGRTIEDAQEIDRLLAQRRSLAEQRKTTPPPAVLKGFNLAKLSLIRKESTLFGTLEGNLASNSLYEIPDLTIDLTPELEKIVLPELPGTELEPPRAYMSFVLTDGTRKTTINVLFGVAGEYKKNRWNNEKLERIVSDNTLSILRETKWQCDWTGAWSAVK